MPIFKVDLIVYVDGYEKMITHLVEADIEENARYDALCAETHNGQMSFSEFMNDMEWEDDCMGYRAYSCKELKGSDQQLQFLRENFHIYKRQDEDYE
jgi:hypothetical protein